MNFLKKVYCYIYIHLGAFILYVIIGLSFISSIFSNMEWGTIADWLSGVGSLAAVVVALYLSKEKPTIDFKIIDKSQRDYGSKQLYSYEIKIKNYSNYGVRLQTLSHKDTIENHEYGVSLTPCGIEVDDETTFIKNITVTVEKNTKVIVFYDVKSKKQFILAVDEREVTM